jgi:hypothetical protein
LFDTVNTFMDINELESFKLSDAVKFNKTLNPRLWGRDEHLLPEAREKLMAIADDFREFLGVDGLDVKDITVSGSNAAYTYTPHSDIDLHLVVAMPDDKNSGVYRELFDAKKYQYNDQHNYKIGGYDVELYVQDADKTHHSQGIYSVLNNDWVSVPRRRRPEVDDISVQSKFEDIGHRIEQAIASGDPEQMAAIAAKVKNMRQSGLDTTGEFGAENLAFKALRTQGVLDQLRTARNAVKDQELSLQERKKKKKQARRGYGGYWYPGFAFGDGEGGGDGGGGESVRENTKSPDIKQILQPFIDSCVEYLGIEQAPKIILKRDPEWTRRNGTFGKFDSDTYSVTLAVSGRHVLDILRTLAHELTHARQDEQADMPVDAGETGSPYEDEANAMAGRIMRHWVDQYPEFFKDVPLEESVKDKLAAVAAAACVAGTPGCATTGADAIRTVQDVGRTAQTMKGYGAADARAEVLQKVKDELRRRQGQVVPEDVNESLDQPYKILRWEKGDYGDVDAIARLDDGTFLSIMFNKGFSQDTKEEAWSVEFYRNNSQEKTGEGDQQRVFATVLSAVETFVSDRVPGAKGKYKPNKIYFSASKEVKPDEDQRKAMTRARLYDSLVQRYARALGFRAFRADTGNKVMYELSRIKPVKEDTEHYNGIEISLEKEDDEIMVKATMAGGRELGHVLFVQEGDYLMPQDLEVDERYQGQGIAATMYNYVKSKGYKIRRSGQQTDAGAGFWDKHRPEQNIWEQGIAEGPFVQRIVHPNKINIYVRIGKKPKLIATDVSYDLLDKYIDKVVDKYPQFRSTDFSFQSADEKVIAEASGYIPVNDKEARDPRYSMAITQDIKPGEVQRQARKMGWTTDRAGKPPLLTSNASNLRETQDSNMKIANILNENTLGGFPVKVLRIQDQGVEEAGNANSGRRGSTHYSPPDSSPVNPGRVEKTATGVRHHADPSRYGGHSPKPEDDRLLGPQSRWRLDRAVRGLNEFAPGTGGDDGDADPYRYPKPEQFNRSVDFFGQFEAGHFDKEDMNDATGEFKGYWGNTQIAYFKFNNPAKTGSDDPGMGWYYEPESDSPGNSTSASTTVDNSEERKKQELNMINAFLKSGQQPKPGSQIYQLMKRNGLAEGSVAKKPQPYNEPGWAKKLSKDQLDAIAGPRYNKDKKDKKVSEGEGRFAGDTPVNIGGATVKRMAIGDTVTYFGRRAKIVDMTTDRKMSRITIANDMGGITKDVLTSDLKRTGVAEAIKLNAPQRTIPRDELQGYADRIKTGTKTKRDKFAPIIHGSNIRAITKDDDNTEWDLDDLSRQITTRPKAILGTNAKMEKSKTEGEIIYDLTLPALSGIVVDEDTGDFVEITTCPGAGQCQLFCYARKGGYVMFPASSMSAAQALNFLVNDPEGYSARVNQEIKAVKSRADKAGIQLVVRWHDAGDFFSKEYLDLAYDVAKSNPDVQFYAYTKMGDVATGATPANFTMNFSSGSKRGEEKKVEFYKQQNPGATVKQGVTVPKDMFFDLIARKGNSLIKDAKGRTQFASPEALNTFKQRIAQQYKVAPDSIITYDQMLATPVGPTPKWNVIVQPGAGDRAANRKDVIDSYLMFH